MSELSNRVDHYKDLLKNTFDFIWTHPETGYKEWQTHARQTLAGIVILCRKVRMHLSSRINT